MINAVYNYYLTTYASNNNLLNNNVHKKSELRDVYNNIKKISKRSPLFKFENSEETQKYAIDIKENAYALKDVSAALDPNSLTGAKKKASSSNEEKVAAKYIGNDSEDDSTGFDLEVKQLATPQVNIGNYIPQHKMLLPTGNYSFDINIDEYSYELQFKINSGDTNRSLQDKLARLINRSDIGISAEIDENNIGNTALKLTSVSTGLGYKQELFSMTNNEDNLGDIVSYLGLNKVSLEASNAKFTLNGDEKSASSNTFTVNKGFEITLLGTTEEGEAIHVGFKPDFDSLLDSLGELSNKYNSVVELAASKSGSDGDSSRLLKEINKIAKRHKSSLESAGLTIDDDGKMSVDNALVTQAVNDGTLKDSLKVINSFKSDLTKQANNMTINPMNYVDKTMISYPNPVKPFSNPYVTSIYTGMMFNGYI